MPDVLPELPIDRLSYARMDATAPGVLLIAEVGTDRGPFLSLQDSGSRAWAMEFTSSGSWPSFTMFHSDSFRGRFLAIDQWRVVVDPASAYLATSKMPRAGDAFISDQKPGWIGLIEGVESYVSTEGRKLSEPAWDKSFVGFRDWSIVTDIRGQEVTILRHSRADPDAKTTI